jgi:hypothetical protein
MRPFFLGQVLNNLLFAQGGIKKDIANNQDQKEIFILLLILRFVLQRVFVADKKRKNDLE